MEKEQYLKFCLSKLYRTMYPLTRPSIYERL